METKGVKLIGLDERIEMIQNEAHIYVDSMDYLECFEKEVVKFKDFTKQPIKLGDFVPCDKDGKPLEKPDPSTYSAVWDDELRKYLWDDQHEFRCYTHDLKEYSEAQSKCIFIGCTIDNYNNGSFGVLIDGKVFAVWKNIPKYWIDFDKTIEELSIIRELSLTSSKAQHLGLIK